MSKHPMHKLPLLFLAALALLVVRPALAWGPEGHRIVAHIAENRLTPEARRDLHQLLLSDQAISDTSICVWPDYIRSDEPETGPWHYVDIPYAATNYDPAVCCVSNQCIVEMIPQMEKMLGDKSAPIPDRTRALRFLVHFLGDIHQPLHCADRDDDRGGNLRTARYPGLIKDTNLHSIWDSNLVLDNMGDCNPLEYADLIAGKIGSRQSRNWSKGTPADWAWETHTLAVNHAYKGVPPTGGDPYVITQAYVDANKPVVELQLMKAGVRLASVLNRCLR